MISFLQWFAYGAGLIVSQWVGLWVLPIGSTPAKDIDQLVHEQVDEVIAQATAIARQAAEAS